MAKARTGGKSQWILGGILVFLTIAAVTLGGVALQHGARKHHQEQMTKSLGTAILTGSISEAKVALDAGADPNGHFGEPYSLATETQLRARIFMKPNSNNATSARRHLSDRGDSALSFAVTIGGPEMVSLLLNRGASPNTMVHFGETPLHYAANRAVPGPVGDSYRAITRLLLAAGADPNAPNSDGNTPLMLALFGHADATTVRILLDARADPDVRNARGASARDFLVAADPAVAALLRR